MYERNKFVCFFKKILKGKNLNFHIFLSFFKCWETLMSSSQSFGNKLAQDPSVKCWGRRMETWLRVQCKENDVEGHRPYLTGLCSLIANKKWYYDENSRKSYFHCHRLRAGQVIAKPMLVLFHCCTQLLRWEDLPTTVSSQLQFPLIISFFLWHFFLD